MTERNRNDSRHIDPALVAEVWSDALPSEDPVLFGRVSMEPDGPVEARSLQTLTLTYTVGRHGMDGCVWCCARWVIPGACKSTTPVHRITPLLAPAMGLD